MIDGLKDFAEQLKEGAKANRKILNSSFSEFGKLEAKLRQNEHMLSDEQKSQMNKAQDIIAKAKKDLKDNLK